ncbi:uncharacterized protein TNCV_4062401 [Trichonephila clavipes]|nr:uncharacterized protein TNCV_4062401 [Trichonephila clavipes]
MPGFCISKRQEKTSQDKVFLLKLAVELDADFREVREQPKQRKNTKGSLPKSTTDAYQHKRFQIGYCKENKTNRICSRCKKYVCGNLYNEHTYM